MRFKLRLSFIAVVLFAIPLSNALAQCRTAVRGGNDDVSHFWRLAETDPVNHPNDWNSDVNRNLADYGVIFEEARTEDCSAAAAVALYKKISETLVNADANGVSRWPQHDDQVDTMVSAYGGWLEGAGVGLIHATGLELGARGKLTVALHNKIMSINYPGNIDAHCGFDADQWKTNNGCMDDFAVAAHAWAWIGAYRKRSPYNSGWLEVTFARQNIAAALSGDKAVCITANRPDGTYDVGTNPGGGTNLRGPCTGAVSDLPPNGDAIPVGLHGGDAIPYGLGLMTSISSAAVGMDVAGAPITLEPDEAKVAEALRTNGRAHTVYNGSANTAVFGIDCVKFSSGSNSGYVTISHDFACNDNYYLGGGYQPKMFPIYDFYQRYVPNTNASADYNFSQWDEGGQFSGTGFFGPGRKAVYKTIGQDWVYPSGRAGLLSGEVNRVSLRTVSNVHYLRAVGGGGTSVDAAATSVGTSERFGLIDLNGGTLNHGDLVQIQVNNGQWVVAENGGPGVVNANRTEPGGWETFQILKTNGTGGAITSGTTVALKSGYGYYVVAEGGGGGAINCDRTAIGPWETFTLTIDTWTSCTVPSIPAQPTSQTITIGQSTTLSVGASGTAPLSYQWYTGTSGNTSSQVPNGTGPSITVTPSTTTSYWVRISNACGTVNSSTATVTVNAPVTGMRQKTPVDFNGDGISDVVLFRNGIWITYNPSTGAEVSRVNTGVIPNGIPEPMDWNGDGRTDYTVFRVGQGWHIYNADGTYLRGIWIPDAGSIPAPADYDGDGKEDFVVYRNGTWTKYDFNTGAVVWSVTTDSFGDGIPVPMDFDGDGRAEFTVFRPGLNWHFYNEDGTYVSGIWIGFPDAVPVPGDYDGNGTEDAVVFNRGYPGWLFYNISPAQYVRTVATPGGSVDGDPIQPAPLDYDGDGSIDMTYMNGGPWDFFLDDGSLRNAFWTGGYVGDLAMSRRSHIKNTP